MKSSARKLRLSRRVQNSSRCVAVLASTTLSACQAIVLDPKGPVSVAENSILYDSLAIMLVIVVPTILGALSFAWWFRASNSRAERKPDFVYSGRVELVTWSIPALTIMLLGGVIWIGSHELDPAVPLRSNVKPVEVEVVSLDWKWLFIYPAQSVASVNQLVVPAGVPVHFRLTSASVMNAFFVPQLGSMIYTMNGMITQLNLLAYKPGEYFGQSTQFSGDGFPGMHFTMRAVPPAEYAVWLSAAHASGPVLDGAAYRALSRQSMNVTPATFRAAAPGLFDDVVMHKLPPGPGPETSAPVKVTQGREPHNAG